MKVAIVGSRDYPDARQVVRFVLDLPPDTIVISGGARGVDCWAETTAHMIGLEHIIHKPKIEAYMPYAMSCLERNTRIVEDADRIVAFWDGFSAGTKDTIDKAQEAGKDLLTIRSDEENTASDDEQGDDQISS